MIEAHKTENDMSKNHPDVRFDAMRGGCWAYRLTQRSTLAELENFAKLLGLRVLWHTMSMIGTSTAEVTLAK